MKDSAAALAPHEVSSAPAALAHEPFALAPPLVAGVADGAGIPASLPRDHPAWQRDVLSVSARARAILAAMHPLAVRALTFWDHVVRRVVVGTRSVEVDPSGCYRLR